jgi:steroid delta-isomerase-like uncharacterized protein
VDENDLPHRLYAAYNQHDPAAVADLYSASGSHEDVADGRPRHGPEAIAAGLQRFFTWFPDARWQTGFLMSDGGGRAAVTYQLTATLHAQMGNVAPRGQRIALRGVQVLEIENGRIGKSADYWDAATFQRQINSNIAKEEPR